jgi:hypothetical protein
MPTSRRRSGSITLPTGQTLAMHTRTHDEEDLPHATKKCATRLHLIVHLHSKIMFGTFIEPWQIISENMRVCKWHVFKLELAIIVIIPGSP